MKKLLSIVALTALPIVTFAQVNPYPANQIVSNVRSLMNTVVAMLTIVATIVFIWGVVKFIFASGDEGARAKAKGIITWGIVGLAVIAGGWGVANIIANYFGGANNVPNITLPNTPGSL